MINITQTLRKRDKTIDILRGFAIIVMIGANMIPGLLKGTPSFFLRLYGSFAAPVFIFLSGMMVSFNIAGRKHTASYFIKRAVILLFWGASIDILAVDIYPFMTFDVLYLIGASIPLTYLFKKLKPGLQYMIVLIIFILTPLLQSVVGYEQMPYEICLYTESKNVSISMITMLKQWFIDGWFPFFPWLGFAFLGSVTADIRLKLKSFSELRALFIGLIIFIAGEIIWNAYPGQMFIRKGYCELFYPPTLGFVLTSIGIILILFYIIDTRNSFIVYKPFSILGRWSLQIYVIHIFIISLLEKVLKQQKLNIFLFIYAGLAALLIGLCNFLDTHSSTS